MYLWTTTATQEDELGTKWSYISPRRENNDKSSPPQMRRGCCGRRPWRGWWATRGIQPPRAGCCQRRPSLSKERSLGNASFTYVALYKRIQGEQYGLIPPRRLKDTAKSLTFGSGAHLGGMIGFLWLGESNSRNVNTKQWFVFLFSAAFLVLSVAAAQNPSTVSPVLAKPAPVTLTELAG